MPDTTPKNYDTEAVTRALVVDPADQHLYMNNAIFKSNVDTLVHFTIPALLVGLRATAEAHDQEIQQRIRRVMSAPDDVAMLYEALCEGMEDDS